MTYRKWRHCWIVAGALLSASLAGCDMSVSTIKEDETPVQQYKHGTGERGSEFYYEKTSYGSLFTVRGVKFTMIDVEGGTFYMGATEITLDDYQISESSVTNELWYAIMGKDESYYEGCEEQPQSHTNSDCEEFAEKLSDITGCQFGIPTEAELEYAASRGIIDSGDSYLRLVLHTGNEDTQY